VIGRALHRVFRRDIGRKLVALMIAVIVWWLLSLYVSDSREISLEVVPVRERADAEEQRLVNPAFYVVVPEGLIVRSVNAKQVRVTVRGLRSEVARMERELYAIHQIPAGAVGAENEKNHAIRLSESMFRIERGLPSASEINFDPLEFSLLLAQEARRTFDLAAGNVTITGTPREGHMFDSETCRIRPSQVELVGPRAIVDAYMAVPTDLRLEPVDITGKAFSVTRQVGLDREKVHPSVTMLTQNELVEVTVDVFPEPVARRLLRVPVEYNGEELLVTRNLRVAEATATLDVIVHGPPDSLDKYTDVDLRKAIKLVYDWSATTVEQGRDHVSFFGNGLPGVTITDVDGRTLEIVFRLDRIETSPATIPDQPDGATSGDSP